MSAAYATRIFRADTDVDRTVSTESIIVFGFLVQDNSNGLGVIELEDVDGNSLGTIKVRLGLSYVDEVKWIADNGLVIKAYDADTFVHVFYSQGGM